MNKHETKIFKREQIFALCFFLFCYGVAIYKLVGGYFMAALFLAVVGIFVHVAWYDRKITAQATKEWKEKRN